MVRHLQVERPDKLIRLHLSEPSPLGLFGLAVGSLLLLCYNFTWTKGELLMVTWIYYLPAFLQLVAGIVDFFRHNIFGATAFTGYSTFWFGLASIFSSLSGEISATQLPKPALQHTGVVCVAYFIFSIALTIISLGLNRTLLTILFFIDFAFFFLALHIFAETPSQLVSGFLIPVVLSCFYGFVAILLNKLAGGEVLPLGAPLINWSNFIYDDGLTKSGHLPKLDTKTQSSVKLKQNGYVSIAPSNYANNHVEQSNEHDVDDNDHPMDEHHQLDIEMGDKTN